MVRRLRHAGKTTTRGEAGKSPPVFIGTWKREEGEVEEARNPEGLGQFPGGSVGGHPIEQFGFAERLAEVVYRPEIIEGVTVR